MAPADGCSTRENTHDPYAMQSAAAAHPAGSFPRHATPAQNLVCRLSRVRRADYDHMRPSAWPAAPAVPSAIAARGSLSPASCKRTFRGYRSGDPRAGAHLRDDAECLCVRDQPVSGRAHSLHAQAVRSLVPPMIGKFKVGAVGYHCAHRNSEAKREPS